jgi:hypothetical protein
MGIEIVVGGRPRPSGCRSRAAARGVADQLGFSVNVFSGCGTSCGGGPSGFTQGGTMKPVRFLLRQRFHLRAHQVHHASPLLGRNAST